MNENQKLKNIKTVNKKKIILNKKEDKKVQSKKNIYEDMTSKEYDELKNKCYFFMRRSSSQNNIFSFKILSNKKRKKKLKNLFKLSNNFDNEIINNITKKYKRKEEEKIIYDNLQPKNIWLNCKRLYNKYKKDYDNLIGIKNLRKCQNNSFLKSHDDFDNMKTKKISNIYQPFLLKPPSQPHINRSDKKAKSFINRNKIRRIIPYTNFSLDKKGNDNNIVNNNKFINKGINYIIKNRDLSNITDFRNKTEDDIFILSEKKKLPFLYSRRLSIGFISTSTIGTNKMINSKSFQQYKINSFFEIGDNKNNNNKEDDEEENDLEIISKKGNVIIGELLFSKKENLESYKNNQSVFNFFCLKKIFNLNDFHIFGVINGKGKEPKIFSRFLKEVLIKKFSDEKNYLNIHGIKSKPKNFKLKSDFIYYALTLEGFIFIKRIFNSLIDELKNLRIDVEESGATLFLIILIKDKIISMKVGDMYSFFIFKALDDNISHIITKNPHLEHLISNIIEQDRFEESKCEFKLVKNEMGNSEYEIIYNNEEIQKCIKDDNIKFTRMVGYLKLKEIGIIGEPDIQILNFNCVQDKHNIMIEQKISNSESSSSNKNGKLINNNNAIFGKLKYIIIGNNELFEFLKIRYYIKEINEALLKDEDNNKNKDNIKYCFNLKNMVKKLVNDSVEMHKKYMKKETFKERCMALITLI